MSDDIDPDRKFSNGTDWDNSIDCDDASDGSDGGYDRHGSPINANAMKEIVQLRMETSRLRAELAAVTAERDRMREALRPFADAVDIFIAENHDAHRTIVTLGDFFHARAAIEGVTEPVALWQHKKTGGVYEIVGECQIEATNAPGVLYRNTSTGVTWMRPKEEFFDGRFVEWRKSEP